MQRRGGLHRPGERMLRDVHGHGHEPPAAPGGYPWLSRVIAFPLVGGAIGWLTGLLVAHRGWCFART
jgi:hypothetical protein